MGGPASTVRRTSPAATSPLRRSDSTESLMPPTKRFSSAKPAGPWTNAPRSTPFQRFPRNPNARVRAASQALGSCSTIVSVSMPPILPSSQENTRCFWNKSALATLKEVAR